MTDVELLTNWPNNPCSACGTSMTPLNDQLTPSPDGRGVLLYCPGCNNIGVLDRVSLEVQARTEKTTTNLAVIDPMSLPDDQRVVFFELAGLWSQLVQSGIDPRRLRATLTK